jgi:hypothetical protein
MISGARLRPENTSGFYRNGYHYAAARVVQLQGTDYNAACDRFDNGDVRRLRKLDRTRPIDAAVALALAVQGATIEQPGSVYDTRGLIAL